jgi:RNA polymerase sigma factor (TIGR02999 family)
VTTLLFDERLTASERAGRLMPLIYEELRALARRQLAAERAGHTLQATALVHEAYLRLIGDRVIPWQNRAHFFSAAAEAMRQILLDHARARGRIKRGGDRRPMPLSVADLATQADSDEILSLDEALCRLMDADAQIGQIVRLRFYAGLSIAETAEALGISPATVKRRWEFGRTWLFRKLSEPASGARDGNRTGSPG